MDAILDELVDTLGLTRLRFEPPRRDWEDALNDDADPFNENENGEAFKKTGTDERVAKVYQPLPRSLPPPSTGSPVNRPSPFASSDHAVVRSRYNRSNA